MFYSRIEEDEAIMKIVRPSFRSVHVRSPREIQSATDGTNFLGRKGSNQSHRLE